MIPVYENGFYFQGHVAQGYNQYFAKKHRHYLFIMDDLMLNPMINEENYREYFGLDGDRAKSFLPECAPWHQTYFWYHAHSVFTWGDGLKVEELLPTYDETLKRFENLGLTIKPIPTQFLNLPFRWRDITDIGRILHPLKARFRVTYFKLLNRTSVPRLPFMRGYADICVVSSKHIRQFAHYCGIFASGNLFAEIALPTALAMCAEPGEIVTQENISLQGKAMWGSKEQAWFAEQYGMRLGKLLTNWPEGVLYIHPVKLSQWSQ